MATKLKKPITVTFTHVENAVCCFLFTHCQDIDALVQIHQNMGELSWVTSPGEVNAQLKSGLIENGIDALTWLPPQPFKIAGRECEFNPDGTVKLSCGTVVSNAEIDDFLKRRSIAIVAEPELPKYWVNRNGSVYRATYAGDVGAVFEGNEWVATYGDKMVKHASDSPQYFKPITRAEAIAKVGVENIDR